MKENIDIILCLLLFYAVASWIISKLHTLEDEPEEPEYTDELSERIKRIYYINEQICKVQELITDIEVSGEDNLKNIMLDWQTAAGKNYTADMWIDGKSEVTAQMRKLAGERLNELTTSLFDEISKLP